MLGPIGPVLPYQPKSLHERIATEKERLEAADQARVERLAKLRRELFGDPNDDERPST
jgi:hypothetical protein